MGEDRCIELLRSEEEIVITDKAPLALLFPVYAWGIPRAFRDALEKLNIKAAPPYVYAVCTCGDDIGTTTDELRNLLQAKGMHLDAFASVQMPETYVAFPGFYLDAQEEARRKLAAACKRIADLSARFLNREKFIDVRPGHFPWLKSHIIKPFFYKLLISDHLYHVSEGCIRCGKCKKVCPNANISLEDGQPRWKGACTGCLACYHHCPTQAIQYGKRTKGKGQYQIGNLTKQLRNKTT